MPYWGFSTIQTYSSDYLDEKTVCLTYNDFFCELKTNIILS